MCLGSSISEKELTLLDHEPVVLIVQWICNLFGCVHRRQKIGIWSQEKMVSAAEHKKQHLRGGD